ncbi:uncharacterized protein [Penaeus vannamei]|uniref:uncharacterized protein n=1 Tax=Penaeus vannamei TaxID=6689 RepID=UPI00387F5C06
MNNHGEYLSHLKFAIAITVFASTLEELQRMLNDLNEASPEVGLTNSPYQEHDKKNEYVDEDDPDQTVTVHEETDHHISLGQLISPCPTSKEHETKRRIPVDWETRKRNSGSEDKNFPVALKRRIDDRGISGQQCCDRLMYQINDSESIVLACSHRSESAGKF